MKAWYLIKHGDPHHALLLRDAPDPVPGPGQVLIRSEGFGLNFADVMAVRGLYRDAPEPPCVLGYETVGRVIACGAGTPDNHLGKRVTAIVRFGGYSELAAADHRAVVPIPEDMPLGVAAVLATQGATAWYLSHYACVLRPDQCVLVHSAAGGVGQLLAMIARHRGCEVFAVAKGAEKMAHLRSIGLAHVIDRAQGDYAEQARALLKGRQMDVCFNAMGGVTFKKDMSLLGSGGALILFGGATRAGLGAFGTLRFVWGMGIVIPVLLMMRSRSVIGVNMLRIGERHPELLAHCMRELVEAVGVGWLKPHVHHTYASAELPDAIAALASGGTIGKVVVRW